MTVPAFLKKKRTYAVLAILLLVGGWMAFGRSPETAAYETAPVERRDLVQTVEVTGSLKPAARIELAFKNAGTVGRVSAKVGDAVKAGQVLAELEDADVVFAARSADASVAIARANLNQRLAGETAQSIRVAETQVEQSRASYDKARIDLEATRRTSADTIATAETNLNTARNNISNQEAIVAQDRANALESARAALLNALGPLTSGLRDGDQAIGAENTAAIASYSNVLSVLDPVALQRARAGFTTAKAEKLKADAAVKAMTAASSEAEIRAAAAQVQVAVELVQTFILDAQKALVATVTTAQFTTADLDAKKAVLDSARTSVASQSTTVLTALQAVKNSELASTKTVQQLQDALKNAEIALQTARTNADVQVKAGETAVAIQLAALDAAKASLDLKKAGPRGVDTEPLRASLQQAIVNAEKANKDLGDIRIVAPVDGIVSEVLPDIGEQVSPNAVAIKLVGTSAFDIEAEVPEADIAKIAVGQDAEITLDAYGDDVKFSGKVSAKDPAETLVQEAVYYKIRVQIDPAGREVKPGMTANVTVKTGEAKDALVLPLRAIRTRAGTGEKTVRVMVDGQPQERVVNLGLRGDEGRVQAISGLSAGEAVVVGEAAKTSP